MTLASTLAVCNGAFLSMADARVRIDAWREDYNHHRPHTSLGNLTPAEFADQLRKARELS